MPPKKVQQQLDSETPPRKQPFAEVDVSQDPFQSDNPTPSLPEFIGDDVSSSDEEIQQNPTMEDLQMKIESLMKEKETLKRVMKENETLRGRLQLFIPKKKKSSASSSSSTSSNESTPRISKSPSSSSKSVSNKDISDSLLSLIQEESARSSIQILRPLQTSEFTGSERENLEDWIAEVKSRIVHDIPGSIYEGKEVSFIKDCLRGDARKWFYMQGPRDIDSVEKLLLGLRSRFGPQSDSIDREKNFQLCCQLKEETIINFENRLRSIARQWNPEVKDEEILPVFKRGIRLYEIRNSTTKAKNLKEAVILARKKEAERDTKRIEKEKEEMDEKESKDQNNKKRVLFSEYGQERPPKRYHGLLPPPPPEKQFSPFNFPNPSLSEILQHQNQLMQQVFSIQQQPFPNKSFQAQKSNFPFPRHPNLKKQGIERICLYCKRKGHWIKDCFAKQRAENNKLGLGGFPVHPSLYPFHLNPPNPLPPTLNPNSIPLLVGPPNQQPPPRIQPGQTTTPMNVIPRETPQNQQANNRQL